MPKISHAGCFGLSLAISLQFTVEMCAAAKTCKKSPKPLFWGVQGQSSMLTNLKSTSPVLAMICSKSVSICNHFHAVRANNGKITSFRGYPTLTLSLEGNPITQGHDILSLKTRVLGAAHGEDFAILGVAVLIQCQSVTDGQTERRTDRYFDDG